MVVISGEAIMAGSTWASFAKMGSTHPIDFAMQTVRISVTETTTATCRSWYCTIMRIKFTKERAAPQISATRSSFHHTYRISLGVISSSAKPRMIIVEDWLPQLPPVPVICGIKVTRIGMLTKAAS